MRWRAYLHRCGVCRDALVKLPGADVPDTQLLVHAAGGEVAAVGRHPDGEHPACVARLEGGRHPARVARLEGGRHPVAVTAHAVYAATQTPAAQATGVGLMTHLHRLSCTF